MRLFILGLLVICANASPQYVKTAGVKGGYSGRGGYQYHGGESLVSNYNNTQHGYDGYMMRTNMTQSVDYEKGVCYVEVPTASLVRDPSHVPAGNGSRPDLSRIRSCCSGYTRNIHNYRICDPVCTNECVNGLCTAPNTCSCFPDHVKNLAGFCIATCPIGCQNGQCSGGECICKDGYRLDSESKFCVPYCREQCGGMGGGNCTAPNTCECRNGYRSTPEGSCKPACDRCKDGECVAPNDCRCRPGYVKNQYGDCEPQCSSPCTPPNRCIAPNVCENPSNPISTTTPSPYGQQPTRVPYGQQPQYPNYPGSQQPNHTGNQQPHYPGSQQPNYPGSQQPNYTGNQQPQYPGSQQPNYPGSQQSYYPGYPQSGQPGNPQSSYPGNPQSNYPGNQRPYYPGQPQPNYPGGQQPNYPGSQQPNYPGSQQNYPGNRPSNDTGNPQNNRPGYSPSNYPGNQPNQTSNQPPNYPGQRPSNYPDGQPIYTHIPSNQPSLYPDSQHLSPDQRPNSPNQGPNSSQPLPNGGVYYPISQYYPGSQHPDQQRPNPNYPNNQQPNHQNNAEPYYPNSQYYPGQQNYPYDQNYYQSQNQAGSSYSSHTQGSEYQHSYSNSQFANVEMVCSQPCINGTCVARDVCACNTGYVPIGSDTSRCEPHCSGCSNGTCVSPYVCVCNPGYFKDFSVKGRSSCVRRIRRSIDEKSAPVNVADLLVFEIPDEYVD